MRENERERQKESVGERERAAATETLGKGRLASVGDAAPSMRRPSRLSTP